MKVSPAVESGIAADSDTNYSDSDVQGERPVAPKHGKLVERSKSSPMKSTMPISESLRIMDRMTPDRLQAIRAFKQEPGFPNLKGNYK